MSYPPPPNGAHNSGPGGGFGPPQGFGPPEQPGPPAGGYGYPGPPAGYGHPGPPAGPGGYGPGGPGAPGGPFPPPPGGGGGGNGGKVAAIIIAAVLVAGLIVGGVLFAAAGGDDDRKNRARSSATPSATAEAEDPSPEATEDPTDLPSLDIPTPSVTAPSELVPYVVLEPGTCFDHPSLSSDVTKVEERSCDEPHNGEVIANETLTGDFATEAELQEKVLELCKADAEKRLKRMPADGKMYYYYAIYPALTTYEIRGEDQISCSLTLSNEQDGEKLSAPLPG